MLVMSRRVGEKILIGDEVVVTVLSISGSQVKLGVDAPAEIRVYREELFNRLRSKNSQDSFT